MSEFEWCVLCVSGAILVTYAVQFVLFGIFWWRDRKNQKEDSR